MPQSSPNVVILSEEERQQLEAASRRYTAPYTEVVRAKLVLLAAAACDNEFIGEGKCVQCARQHREGG